MPVLVLAAAAAMTWVAILRLDAVAPKLPGVWAPSQLLPVGQDAFYGLGVGQGNAPIDAAAREASLRSELRALVDAWSTDVAVASWRQDTDDLVAVAVLETADPAATARAVDGQSGAGGVLQTTKAWTEGDSYVAVVGIAATPVGDAPALADRASRQVETSVLAARVWWFVAVAVIPPLVVATAAILGGLVLALVVLALLLVRLAVFVVIQLPMAILTRGRVGTTKPPRVSRPQPRPPTSLAPHVRCVDVDETDVTDRAKSFGAAGRVLLLMAVAVPALTPTWWPGSLVWAAATGAWLGLGPLRRRWPALGVLRWALIALAVLAIADAVAGIGPGSLTGHPIVAGAMVLLAVIVFLLILRDALSPDGGPSYVSSFSDLGPRSIAYLVGALGISFSATCLFLGSNGDPDVGSQAIDKSIAAIGLLLAVPFTVRRFRAAQRVARREWAREQGVGEVLLLRSFLDDGRRVRSRIRDRTGLERFVPMRRESFEDVVVRAFEARGPVVAIAKPGTGQGEFGAARDRIVIEDWLTAVKAEMAESAYVVAVLGPTEGLHVELETLSALDLLPRVCLLVPPVEPADAAARIALGTSATEGPSGWGTLEADRIGDRHVLALAGVGTMRLLFLCSDRNSVRAYLRLGQWLAYPPRNAAKHDLRARSHGQRFRRERSTEASSADD
jgi:hypothetical protein